MLFVFVRRIRSDHSIYPAEHVLTRTNGPFMYLKQVYSAEEKRALTLINFEEKQQRENKLLGDFRQMLTQRMKEAEREKELLEKANVK